uniref:Putative proteasome subunit alpha type-5-like protein n=1 Tax=Pinctada fucata TaxID=50426 RepID=A0A194AKL0_PINFU
MGTFIQYDAKAIGSGSEGAQQALQDVYHKSMTLREACKSALTILKQVMEEKLNSTNVEMGTVTPQRKFHMFTKEELEDVIKDI